MKELSMLITLVVDWNITVVGSGVLWRMTVAVFEQARPFTVPECSNVMFCSWPDWAQQQNEI